MLKNAYIGMNIAVPIIISGLFLMTFLVVGQYIIQHHCGGLLMKKNFIIVVFLIIYQD